MRQEPSAVCGIAMETESDMIPDTAQAHGSQYFFNHLQGPCITITVVTAQQEKQSMRRWKFRSPLETTGFRIKTGFDLSEGCFEKGVIGFIGRFKGKSPVKAVGNAAGRSGDFFAVVHPQLFDLPAYIYQTRASAAAVFGQIGGGEKRLLFRRHENTKRPTAASGQHLTGGHIDCIDIRALLAIHLYTDKGVIQVTCSFFVLKRFFFHDVAPVAGGISDGKKNRLVLRSGF